MANRRLTYVDLREWLVAEQRAIANERAGRVVGRRGQDGETVYETKPRDVITSGPANADLVADYAGRDRKTILRYRKADWPRSAWLPLMQNDWKPFAGTPEPSEEDLEQEFHRFIARYRRGGRHRASGEVLLDALDRGALQVPGIDAASMSDEELADYFGVSAKTIQRRRVRDRL